MISLRGIAAADRAVLAATLVLMGVAQLNRIVTQALTARVDLMLPAAAERAATAAVA